MFMTDGIADIDANDHGEPVSNRAGNSRKRSLGVDDQCSRLRFLQYLRHLRVGGMNVDSNDDDSIRHCRKLGHDPLDPRTTHDCKPVAALQPVARERL